MTEPYVSPETFQTWYQTLLGGRAGDYDADVLARILASATTTVSEHCRRTWAGDSPDASARLFWPTSATGRQLVVGVAADATAVLADGDTLPTTSWALVPTGGPAGVAVLLRRDGRRWTPGEPVTLTASYDAGTPPDAVVEACCRITSRWLASALAQSGDLINVLDTGVQLVRPWRDPDVMALLERHVVDVGR